MASPVSLSIAFLGKNPLQAARELSVLPPGDAAVFLETVPPRAAARALSQMGAGQAALVLARIPTDPAASILRDISDPDARAILHLLPPDARTAVLEALPSRSRRRFETALSFPDDTVGAHMSMLVQTCKKTMTIADARQQILKGKEGDADLICIVDDDGTWVGAVKCSALIRHPDDTPLIQLMDKAVVTLSARARLSSVIDLDEWDSHLHLPVVNRRKKIAGILSKTKLRRALEHGDRNIPPLHGSIAVSMAEALFVSGFGLAQLLIDVNTPPSADDTGQLP